MCMPMAPRPTNPARILTVPYSGEWGARSCGFERTARGRERRRGGATIVQSRVPVMGQRIDFALAAGGPRRGYSLLLSSGGGAAEVIHIPANAYPIGIGLRVREVLLLAVLAVLGDAARMQGLVVGFLGILALLFTNLGEVLPDRRYGGRGGRRLGGRRIRARGWRRGVRGTGGVRGGALPTRGLDQLRARHPLVTVVVDALRIFPAIDVRIRMGQSGHAGAGSQDQGNAHSSQHRKASAAPV